MRDRPDPKLQAFLAEVERVLRIRAPGRTRDTVAREAAARGWWAPEWPARWGGAGLSPQAAFLLDRALTIGGIPRPDPANLDRTGALLMGLAPAPQCDRWLPALAAGRETWVLHGSLMGANPLPMVDRPGPCRLAGSTLVQGAAAADRMLALAETRGDLVPVVVTLAPGAVTPGLPLDPDRVDLPTLSVALLGEPGPADAVRTAIARALTGARPGRCRTAPLRGTLHMLNPVAAADESLRRRLDELEVTLLGLEAMELRALFAADGVPDEVLHAALSVRADELACALAEIAIAALGYHALPAPDPHRQHNELPDLMTGGGLPGADAIGALLRYVGGLDRMGARDRLAHLTGTGSDEG